MTRDRIRVTVAATVLAGAVVLAFMLRSEPGSAAFYTLTVVLAAVWATGALLAGPVALGQVRSARHVVGPFLLGLALVAVFTVGGLVIREIPLLADAVRHVLSYTGETVSPGLVLVTVLAGVAEELFFRGPMYDVVPRHPVTVTAVVYAVATAATGNFVLAFAALLIGVVTALQRRATGGVLAPAITHITWSVGMLLVLPPMFL